MGITAGLVWRGFETWSQISFRNRVRCTSHLAAWLRARTVPVHLRRRRLSHRCKPHPGTHPPAESALAKPLSQILVANDWARTKVFGRDTSRV